MLTFSRISNAKFSGAKCIPAVEISRTPPSCSILVNAKKPIPASATRREQHMVSLLTEYACRWCVTMDPALPFDNEEAETTAFYAAISEMTIDQRRSFIGHRALTCSSDAATDTSLKLVASEYVLVDTCNQCKSAALHDWSADKFTKQCMNMASRAHVLVHYVHPCACAGRQLMPLSAEEAAKVAALAATTVRANAESAGEHADAAAVGAAAASVVDPLFRELLERVSTVRKSVSSETVVEKIESERASRLQRAAQSRQFAAKFINAAQMAESRQQCSQFLQRAAAAQNLRKRASSEENSDDNCSSSSSSSSCISSSSSGSSDSDDDESSDNEIDGEASMNRSDSDDSSDTFSDEAEEQGEPETEKVPEEETLVRTVSITEEKILPTLPSVPVTEPVVTEDPVAAKKEEKEEAEKKQLALRQSACELMIPICLPTDTIEQFEKLECNFVAQWAATDDLTPAFSKIHLFRKQSISSAYYFGMYKTVETRFHLVATIATIN